MTMHETLNSCPLSSPQRGIWFDQIRHVDTPLYNIGGYVQIDGPLNVSLLEKAINRVIQENDALRMFFQEGTPMPVPVFKKILDVTLDFHDFSSEQEPHQHALQWMESEFATPFQLYNQRLFKYALIKISEKCYYVFGKFHHLIVDGWGISLVFQRIAKQYNALITGDTSEASAHYSYLDFIQDDQKYLQSEAYKRQEQYWQEKYRDLPEPLFPYRYAAQFKDIVPSHRQALTLNWDFYQRLITFAKNNKVTTFHAILGVLYCYFMRTGGGEDFVIGLPVLNRNSAVFKHTVGLFTGVTPARFRFGTALNFIELMQSINTELRKEYRHQRFPLGDINKLAGLHTVGHEQLFDITLSYQKHDYLTTFAGSPAKVFTLPNGFEQTALAIAVEEYWNNQNVRMTFDYNLGAFDDAEMVRIIARIECLLNEVLMRPTIPIRDLNLMPEEERHQVLVKFNDTAAPYPFDKTIVDLFEEQVVKTPRNVAVVFESQQLTYQELNTRANQLAHHLQTLGVKPEVLVGIYVERSLEMVIGLLGILKAGGAYVPLDPNYPQERLAFMFADSHLQVLLTQQKFVEKHISPIQNRIVCLDTDQEIFSNAPTSNPVSGVQPDNLAYVIYTSGTTGKPKGVLVHHRSLLNLIFWHQQAFEITAADRATQLANTAFDAHVWEVWPYLAIGARLYLATPDVVNFTHHLQNWLLSKDITISFLPTPLAEQVLALEWPKSLALRILLTGGDKLHQHPQTSVPFKLINNYGPTENTVVTTSGLVISSDNNEIVPSIGRPIANTQVYILDYHLQPVPIGVPGELHIGGVGLAVGYLNRPELTTEKFIPNPFSNVPQARLYKTGDLACYLSDGNIEYLGRIDHQVKIRGFRIELGEIEAVLAQHPHIQETALIIHEDTSANKRLVAFFVSDITPVPTFSELRDFLQEKLPDYMLPSFFIGIDALPLTPNGKVNRRALQALVISYPLSEDSFVAPRTQEEEMLAGIWADILGVERVGIDDNFFELGGHSLLATQVMSRIRDTFSLELPLRHLFESPTVSSLAEQLKASCSDNSLAPPIQVIERAENLPLSFAQQRLWFLDQLEGGHSATYNMPAAVRLLGPLHFTAFEQSLTAMVQRHETLRTTFPKVDDSPIQKIQPLSVISYQLSVTDIQSLPVEKHTTEVQRLANEEAQRPFELAKGPLLRTILLKVGPQEHVLLATMHHIISDGWSVGVFIREIANLYEAFAKGEPSPLSPLPIQYADFAHWQRQWLTGEVLETQLNYWQQQLAGSPALLELPTDHPRPALQTFRGHVQAFEISQALTRQLKQLSHKHGTTLFMTLFSAFVILLHRYSGQEDIVVGSPIANRNHSEMESLIGLFVNTLVLRTDLSGNPSFTNLLNQIKKVSLEAYAHQDVPFEQLVEALQPQRNLSYSPFFQVMFVLQNAPRKQLELSGLSLNVLDRESVTAKFDLTLFLEETEQNLKGCFEYNADLFNADTIVRMIGHFQTLLEGSVANPAQSIAELPLLTKTEQHQLLVEWNDTSVDYPNNQCIHQFFESQVEKAPDTVAVVFEDQQLSYKELNVRANQLAHYLQTLGVGADVLVGICVERSLNMIIGLFSILKSGGAYVPLDPNYPQERLAFMLEDSQVSVLLTENKLMTRLPSNQAQIICLDSEQEIFSKASPANPVSAVQPNHLAYVIYTSGSTGQPKGVAIEHHSTVVLLNWAREVFTLEQLSGVLASTSLCFDLSVFEIFVPLSWGGTVIVVENALHLATLSNDLNVTLVNTVPSAIAELVRTDSIPASVQVVNLAGEALKNELVQKIYQQETIQHVFNLYGPSEDTTYSTFTLVEKGCTQSPAIGRPIANTQIYILDSHHRIVPIGVSGELYIGGEGLARGYLNRPELSQEKFIPNPFSKVPQARLYKTGDLARYLPDSNIEYLGRIDHQIKIRGFRIELGEIETLLGQHPNVRESVVIAREDKPGNQRLVAYLVSNLIPERIPYQSKCMVELNGKILTLHTKDISGHGICLQQDKTLILDAGKEIRLCVLLPKDSEPYWLQGKVVWSRPSWAGVKFTLTQSEQISFDRRIESLLIEDQGLLKVVQNLLIGNVRQYLEEKLPNYMVPSHFVLLTALPLTPNGKINRRALPVPDEYASSLLKKELMPQTELENLIAAVWQEVLQTKKVGIYDHFFEIGGHSLLIAQVQSKLQEKLDIEITMVELFEYPTIHALAQHLSEKKATPMSEPQSQLQTKISRRTHQASGEIAIIGMAGRFPGANDIDAFWQNLRDGVESITFFSDPEMASSGIDTTTLSQPNYVKAGGVLSDIDLFDANFFDLSPKEAEMMDPQQRLFLECAWQAIENAGIAPGTDEYAIGVYAGVGANTYLLNNLYPHQKLSGSVDNYQLMIGNGNDFLPTRVSYKLNLKGPSVDIQTACSTSLVAVHSACHSLQDGECNIALAGGVSVRVPQKAGYLYQEGMIYSPDGHCRAFDTQAQGTVGGNGVGVVVLKRVEDAIADGDYIHAIIKGSAINNDGSVKVGYTAPSVEGQAAVISEALDTAGIKAETISYIETHGTGTKLGDPIEMAALTKTFRSHTQKQGFCAIGSVKTNIGHTDTAAGVTGLIKTVLALKHQQLPPSLHFEQPNPQIDFVNGPFYVNTKLSEWHKINGAPHRAGVSSFGIGGTNAHVVLEEAPTLKPSGQSRPWQLLVFSAKTDSALETATANMATYLEQHSEINLADVAYTLSKGRKAFRHRRMLICQECDEAALALRTVDPQSVLSHFQELEDRPVVFMFPGQGTQYVNMGLELYQTEPTFRKEVDQCAEYLKPHLGFDLRQVLYPSEAQTSEATQQLKQTALTQPTLFVINYALAKLWMAWGVHPEAMIGHSIGEYVAACIAGVFSLEEALALVAARGQLMQQLPSGAMLSVSLSEREVQPLLGQELSLAAVNAPSLCVVSGVTEAVEALENQLTGQGVECRRLHTYRAFHSKMMEPILASFTDLVKQVKLCTPQIPYLSNVTGTWMTAEKALNHNYWVEHLRQTVRFADGMQKLLKKPERILLEVGPGRTLSTLARRHPDKVAEQIVLSSLRHPKEQLSDVVFLLNTLGKLWITGGSVDWSVFYAHEHRHRLPLPTYPFERQRYWIDSPKPDSLTPQVSQALLGKKQDIADWFYRPAWKESVVPAPLDSIELASWLVFEDKCGLGSQLVKKLEQNGQEVITVKIGSKFMKFSEHDYTLNPQESEHYEVLLKELRTRDKNPQYVFHLWNVTSNEYTETFERVDKSQELGFYSLLFLAQAFGKQNVTDKIQIAVVSNNMQAVTDDEILYPEKATVLGPVKVIGQEYPNLVCRSIDVVISEETGIKPILIEQLLAELTTKSSEKSSDQVIAYRGRHRWVQTFEPVKLAHTGEKMSPRLKEGGVYLITGGLGGIGFTLAEHLAKTVQAKLVLIGRSVFPARNEWDEWLVTHHEHDDISRKIRKVQALEELGSEILIISADVTNLQQMQKVFTTTEQQFGLLNGVIHAAGLPDGALVLRQTRKMAETVLAPKVKGTLVLDSLLREINPDFFILCSSVTSILGTGGQIGYCAANAFLDVFAQFKMAKENGFTLAINWDTWQEVGMAVAKNAKKFSHHFQNRKFNSSVGSLVLPNTKPKTMNHPLFDYCIVDGSDQEIYVTHFSLLKHWVLREHKSMGNGLLPGTAYLEMVKAAFEQNHSKNGIIEIRQVYFLIPLVVEEHEEKEVRTILKKQDDYFEFFVVGQNSEEEWQEHARGEIACINAEPPKKHDLKTIEAKCNGQTIILTEEDYDAQANQFIEFGPRWKSLRQIQFGKSQALTLLELSESFADDIPLYQLHPALLDDATGVGNIDYFCPSWKELPALATSFLSVKEKGAYYLPFSYKRLRVKGTLSAKAYSYVRHVESGKFSKGIMKFNVTIMDEQGTELLEIEEYTLRKVDFKKVTAKQPQTQNISAVKMRKTGGEQRNVATGTNVLQKDFQEGLLPTEGIEVFDRILGSTLPQIIVSTQDLHSRFDTVLSSLKELEPEQPKSTHPRPKLTNAYIAPRNELEQKISALWQQFLGVEQVGIYDDFFELGGDSLLAIQLIAKLSEMFQTKLSANSLFNSPTIATLAEVIGKVAPENQVIRHALSPLVVEIQAGNFLFPPLFLIHPLGGHVFIYRELAYHLGSEQPVYGIQAQGFEGEAELLTKVEDMATLYIEALRVRQPEGPYFIGGTSFGGMIAFEIAQQLHALGQKVVRLIMMDTFGPGQMPKKMEDDAEFFAYLLDLMFNVSVSLDEIQKLNLDERLLHVWEKEKKISERLPNLNITQLRRIYHITQVNNQAMWNYKPRIYSGQITFFHAKERDAVLAKNPELAWIDLAEGGLEVHKVPGNHFTMNYSPHVQVMAELLKPYLA